MGNDQLLPAYNFQIGVADEYIAVVDVTQHCSDIDCFVPLMEKYMKFPMYKKEATDEKYHNNPRPTKMGILCVQITENFIWHSKAVRGNKYGRQEEIYKCEDCNDCPYSEQ